MNKEKFIKDFANQFDDTDESEITADTDFTELDEWSSLTVLSIIAMVKTEYGKSITGAQIRSCETVEDLFNLVSSL
jgi:acyl carrier protein